MRREWANPFMLPPRPRHRTTEAERADFLEAVEDLGMIAAHLGISIQVDMKFPAPRPPRKKAP